MSSLRQSVRRHLISRFNVFGLLCVFAILFVTWPSHLIITEDSMEKLRVLRGNETASSILQSNGFVRNCITGSMVGRLPARVESVPIDELMSINSSLSSLETEQLRRNSFQKVFDERIWGNGSEPDYKGPIASGPGSTLNSAQETILILSALVDQFKQLHGVRRVRLLDVPCGDMLWMSRFLKTRDDIDYTGVDLVPDLINSHRKSFATQSTWKFVLTDIVLGANELFETKSAFDLILCRQMLQHLYHSDVIRALINLSSLAARSPLPVYLLTTTFNGLPANADLIDTGSYRFRELNLEVPPVSLEPPLCVARDGVPESPNHFVGLWRLPLRRIANCRTALPLQAVGFQSTFFSCVDWTLDLNKSSGHR